MFPHLICLDKRMPDEVRPHEVTLLMLVVIRREARISALHCLRSEWHLIGMPMAGAGVPGAVAASGRLRDSALRLNLSRMGFSGLHEVSQLVADLVEDAGELAPHERPHQQVERKLQLGLHAHVDL